ncbi:MAG: hypothetical protein ACU0A4_09425 [Paracoccaceae bacterium]
MTKKATYQIRNGDDAPFIYSVKPGTRIHESLEALIKGPLPAPAYTRRSDHILHLRRSGLLIETEFRKQAEDSEHKFGVYHLKSVVVPVSEVSQ